MSRLRIVVADDHQPMRDYLVRLLSRDFDVVDAVDNGEAVVESAARLKPDVLVLDIAMPVMSGIAAAARLRSAGSDVRIVFVTMHADREFVATFRPETVNSPSRTGRRPRPTIAQHDTAASRRQHASR